MKIDHDAHEEKREERAGAPMRPKGQHRAGVLLSSVSRKAGGMMTAVSHLVDVISHAAWRVDVFALADEWTAKDSSAWLPVVPKAFITKGPKAFGYAPELSASLHAASLDLLHVHGLWMFPSVAALAWHNRTHRPYLVSPHGMLDSWALRNSLVKKRIAAALFERRHLHSAHCIHALSAAEAESIRAYGLKQPICIIPNGIDPPNPASPAQNPYRTDKKILLYLGRLHPKKNLAALLQAWAAMQKSESTTSKALEWALVIAGWDEGGYEADLKQLANELGLVFAEVRGQRSDSQDIAANPVAATASVIFLGPIFAAEKEAAFRACDAFVLPSLSEGLPMSILEAWSYAKPVLMTPECNLPEGFAVGAALPIGITENDIADGLRHLLEMTDRDRAAMGERGRALVAEEFSWSKIGQQMREVYGWLLGGGTPPSTIRID